MKGSSFLINPVVLWKACLMFWCMLIAVGVQAQTYVISPTPTQESESYDTPLTPLATFTGNLSTVVGGTSFFGINSSAHVTSRSFNIDIPSCSGGNPTIVAAYLSFYHKHDNFDFTTMTGTPTFDTQLDIQVGANPTQTAIATNNYPAVFYEDSPSDQQIDWRLYSVADVTSSISSFLTAGTHLITVSDWQETGTAELGASGTPGRSRHYGAGLTVIYECPTLDNAQVVYYAGLDWFYCQAPVDQEAAGDYSNTVCLSITPEPTARTVSIDALLGGQANDMTPFRGGRVFYVAGTGSQLAETGLPYTGIVVNTSSGTGLNQRQEITVGGTPQTIWNSNAGMSPSDGNQWAEWDVHNDLTINIPANAEWICIQSHSVQSNGSDRCISGDVLSPVLTIPLPPDPDPCALTVASAIEGVCNGNEATVTVTVNWMNAPSGEDILVTATPVVGSVNSASPQTVTVNSTNGSGTATFDVASPGAYSINAAFETTTSCSATTFTFNSTVCSPPPACMLTDAGETLETCNNNGTAANPADDYITFSLNPVGTNTTTYTVTADNGGMVTLAGGGAATGVSYGSATAFRLQNGSADGLTTYTITITDDADPTCTATTTVSQSSCSGCSLTIASAIDGVCNGNESTVTVSLDWMDAPAGEDIDVTITAIVGGVIGAATKTVTVGSTNGSGTTTFDVVSPGAYSINAAFETTTGCSASTFTFNSTVCSPPSCPTGNCFGIQVQVNGN